MERKTRGIIFDAAQADNILRGNAENSTFLKWLDSEGSLEELLKEAHDGGSGKRNLGERVIRIEY